MRRTAALALFTLALTATAQDASAARPLRTAITNYGIPAGRDATVAYARMRAAGANAVHIGVHWGGVAVRKPANATDPADPAYRWNNLDEQVRLAVSHGLQPIVNIGGAPEWAQERPRGHIRPDPSVSPRFTGPFRPSPQAFGQFARAAARRYSGSFGGIPRVRYWQAWGEPNVSAQLSPQFIRGRPASPSWYRALLNSFAASVRSVSPGNYVIAAGLSPFTVKSSATITIGPLRFMRELLCVSSGKRPRRTCRARADFDIWAHHPYTSGGPTRSAYQPDDVSLGDLREMRALLQAAVRLGRVRSRHPVDFWVTEFSWDSRPPDPHPRAVPIGLHARWVAEALFRMWQSGVSLVTWGQLRDLPHPASPLQSGLYFYGGPNFSQGQAKPAVAAFRFPFVAYRGRRGVTVWGRTPGGKPGQVAIERRDGRSWRRLRTLRTNRLGIFSGRLRSIRGGTRTASAPKPVAAAQYRERVLADNPASYWRLGERTGSVARDETGRRQGRFVGGVRLGAAGAVAGDSDRAITLDGRNDVVELGPLASPRTIELWLKTTTDRGAAAFSNRNTVSHYAFLGAEASGGALAFDTLGLLGSRWITDGRWHHLVYTYTGTIGRLYVDGTLDVASTWTRLEGGAPASLGYDASLRTHFKGSLDEVAVYDYPLSEAQIKAHYRASGQRPATPEQFPVRGKGPFLRARLTNGAAASLPFSLTRPADRYVLPFGG